MAPFGMGEEMHFKLKLLLPYNHSCYVIIVVSMIILNRILLLSSSANSI